MYILSNQVRFDFQKYGADSIIKESVVVRKRLGAWQNRQSFEIRQSQLTLQDLALNLDEVTELQDSSVFRLVLGFEYPSFDPTLVGGISIGLSMDVTLIERKGYTLLDVLSDVGGMQGFLISGTSLLLSILNYNQLDNYLVSKLFRSESVTLIASQKENILDFCLSKLIPSKLVCCRKKRKQIVMERARAALEKEVDVIQMIRTRRFVLMALKHLLDPALHKEFKSQSQALQLDTQRTGLPVQEDKSVEKRSRNYDVTNNLSSISNQNPAEMLKSKSKQQASKNEGNREGQSVSKRGLVPLKLLSPQKLHHKPP